LHERDYTKPNHETQSPHAPRATTAHEHRISAFAPIKGEPTQTFAHRHNPNRIHVSTRVQPRLFEIMHVQARTCPYMRIPARVTAAIPSLLMPTLIVTAGPSQGVFLQLANTPTIVGRADSCTLQLNDERVSNKHLELRYEQATDSYHVLDLKSTNGTFVENKKLDTQRRLADNALISIGNSRLLFTLESLADQPAVDAHIASLKLRGGQHSSAT
jgi:hypothetical protein